MENSPGCFEATEPEALQPLLDERVPGFPTERIGVTEARGFILHFQRTAREAVQSPRTLHVSCDCSYTGMLDGAVPPSDVAE
ncbi:MAG: hypothetical protein ACXAEN_25775 [Candidatus Thorarchaeota archaeon]